jgi:hypothetical protein
VTAVNTAITRDPPAAPPPELYPQLIYTLDRWDYVAWWMCQWDRAHPVGKAGPGARLRAWLFWWLPLWFVGATLVAVTLMGRNPALRTLSFFGALAMLAAFLWAIIRTGCGPVWKLARDHHQHRMQDRALDLQTTGEVINRERIHWFLLFPECFQEVTELRRASPAGIEDYQFRVRTAPWALLREVVVHEQHVFLVGPGEEVWIIPKRCFADVAAVADFLDAVYSCQRTVTHGRFGAIVPAVENPEAIQAGGPAR